MVYSSPSAANIELKNVESRRERKALQRWSRFLRPSVLGCFGLALAILLWGYNYRLSQYQSRDIATRAQLTKFWLDQRNGAAAATARVHVETRPSSSGPFDDGPLRPFELTCICALLYVPVPLRSARDFKSLLPLRSPPSPSFSA
ncbi:MAG TPA: hypothetical protein VHW46_09020 [Terracidiphilus sp.]|jgi:hypothetical protein|nr:hypothetical protein [Terracidiphilus sp.]